MVRSDGISDGPGELIHARDTVNVPRTPSTHVLLLHTRFPDATGTASIQGHRPLRTDSPDDGVVPLVRTVKPAVSIRHRMVLYFLLLAGLLAGFVALVVYLTHVEADRRAGRRRNALPGTYSPEAYLPDPEKIPGRCPACYADNDPKYDYCQNCATELPEVEPSDGRRSLRQLFGVD